MTSIPTVGDELITDANMIFDHVSRVHAPPADVWPWLVQLGKGRAGWYLPTSLERLLPRGRRSLRHLDARWLSLSVGDVIPDYGGRDEWLQVAILEDERALVYRSERRGRSFTWALLLTPADTGNTDLRLRFRGRIRSVGVRHRAIVALGGFFDWLTGWLMVRGLRERAEAR